MKGARILAGVATFTVACALPSVAFAQIGACPTLLPPPCIVNDPGRIAGIVAEIKEKKDQLENAVQQVQQATTLNGALGMRSEEHTYELQSLMRNSYAVFCLKKKKTKKHN